MTTKSMVADLVFKTVFEKLDNCVKRGEVYIDDEDLFEIINEFIENEGEYSKKVQEYEHVILLNNFNYYQKQELYICDSEDENFEKMEPITILENLKIEPTDVIRKNNGDIKDFYRIGKKIGVGTYA